MTLKSITWAIILGLIVFFTAIYLGIKYEWVQDAEPKLSSSANVTQSDTVGTVAQEASSPLLLDENEKSPELIDEPETTSTPLSLGSTELSIEEIVSQCQTLTQSIGVPEAQVEQATMECINRNSTHLTQQTESVTDNNEIQKIREECDSALVQRELLSEEEIKILLDECVASASK
ncbi:hypothetical protein EOL70_09340 [Leucothrix sargassi]|nr:hypothetical protein EOL70_09340 [Leucothrix sargassi]